MANKVLLKKSSVVGKVPTTSDLSYGEVALNYADGKLYYTNSANQIKYFADSSQTPSLSINDLTDVDTVSTPPSIGQVLKWNGTNWVPAEDSTTGGSGTDADTLDGFDSTYFLNYNNLSNKPNVIKAAVPWTANHTIVDGTRYLVGDVVYDNGNIFVANYENESIPTSSSLYWTNLGSGNRLNIDGRDIPNITYNQLIDKPTLFSGNYNDLTNKPTLVQGADTSTDNAIARFDSTTGKTLQNSLVTISDSGAITAPAAGSVIPFYWNNQAAFPNASTYHGAIAHSHADGRMYFAHAGAWASLANFSDVPTNTNQLTNGAGYITSSALSGYATETYVNTQVSNLVDSSPATLNTLNELAAALGDDPNFATTISNQIGLKANTSSLASVATSGSYNDLTNKPTLFSGSYSDLTNKPTIATTLNDLTDVNVQGLENGLLLYYNGSQWVGTELKSINGQSLFGEGDITISGGSGFSGNYNDLTNKPTIPTVPNNVSAFNNDANYVNTTQLATKQNTLVSGTNVKTINGQSLLGSGNITISGGSGGGDALYTNTATLTTTSSNQTVDSFDKTQYRTVKYLIQAISGSEVHTTEVTLTHNDTNVFINEYGTMYTGNNPLITITSSIDTINIYLTVTPANADTVIDLTRISIIARVLGGTTTGLEGDLNSQTGSIDLMLESGSVDLLT